MILDIELKEVGNGVWGRGLGWRQRPARTQSNRAPFDHHRSSSSHLVNGQAPSLPRHVRVADLEQVRRLLDPALAHRLLLGRRHIRDVHVVSAGGGVEVQGRLDRPSAPHVPHITLRASPACLQALDRSQLPFPPSAHVRMPVTSPLMTSLVGRSGVVELPLM